MSEKSENKIIFPKVLDANFTFLMYYFYRNFKILQRKKTLLKDY